MNGCVYREEDGKCRKFTDEKITSFCVDGPCEDERPSNADRIRAFTDEELAEFFADNALRRWDCEGCRKPRRHMAQKSDCEICWLDWLRQEVDDGT